MGKHTLRNLGAPTPIKKKHPKIKIIPFRPSLLFLAASVILIVSTIATNAIIFSANHFYINGCQLGYENNCADVAKRDIIAYVALMILPIAFTAYAAARAFAKHQIFLGITSLALILLSIFSPSIVVSIHRHQIENLHGATLLSIEAPGNDNNCAIVGLPNTAEHPCRVVFGDIPFRVHKTHNNAVIPLEINDDHIIVHLDTDLNIYNATKQDIRVCTYFGDNPQANCRKLNFFTESADSYSDNSYSYSYLGSELTITENK